MIRSAEDLAHSILYAMHCTSDGDQIRFTEPVVAEFVHPQTAVFEAETVEGAQFLVTICEKPR
jgi:hypothetical protein